MGGLESSETGWQRRPVADKRAKAGLTGQRAGDIPRLIHVEDHDALVVFHTKTERRSIHDLELPPEGIDVEVLLIKFK